jgi:hypothetical protein
LTSSSSSSSSSAGASAATLSSSASAATLSSSAGASEAWWKCGNCDHQVSKLLKNCDKCLVPPGYWSKFDGEKETYLKNWFCAHCHGKMDFLFDECFGCKFQELKVKD